MMATKNLKGKGGGTKKPKIMPTGKAGALGSSKKTGHKKM